jgi:fatty acid desaturase
MAVVPSSLPALGRARLAFELARPFVLFGLYCVFAANELWILAVPAAIATFLAGFVLLHDAMHAALGLPRSVNEVVLAASGLLILKSGHGLRVSHLRHHGRTLAEDDPEGGVVHWPMWRIVLAGPFHILGNRALTMRLSPPTRGQQLAETALTVLVVLGAIALFAATGSPAGLVYWAAVFVLSATMALWAAYIPHVLSSRHVLVRSAAFFSRWWTPVLSSFAFHHLHHAYPRVPTALLADLAREVGPEVAFADETLHTR